MEASSSTAKGSDEDDSEARARRTEKYTRRVYDSEREKIRDERRIRRRSDYAFSMVPRMVYRGIFATPFVSILGITLDLPSMQTFKPIPTRISQVFGSAGVVSARVLMGAFF